MNIENKVVVITGGASGLGRATAEYLVKEKGANVALLDLDEKLGAEVVQDLGGDKAFFIKTDVTSEPMVDNALQAVIDKFGAVHANINAAGIPLPAKMLDREGRASCFDRFKTVINVNLVGLYLVMSRCAEKMLVNEPDLKGERGVIVNVSSGAAFEGQIGQIAYSASKAGINGINMPAARELGVHGIRVNSIAPGLFATPLVKTLDENVQEALAQMCEAPKRMGDPSEFASACAFLIENSYMNARTIRLDAATVMQAK